MVFRMNRVLSRPCLFLRQARSYRQDMPPPGGYAAIPWRRSIPTRGFGYIGVLISGYLIFRGDYIAHQRYTHWRKQSMVSSRLANTFNNFGIFSSKQLTWIPLVCHCGKPKWTVMNSDLSNIKWKVSSDNLLWYPIINSLQGEAVNIVASGFDKNWKVGGYGVGDNGNPEYWPSNGYKSPYNLQIWKNWNGNRFAKQYTPAHQAMSM